jgi:hypothetical protein
MRLEIAERNEHRRGYPSPWSLKQYEYARLNFITARVSRLSEVYTIYASRQFQSTHLHIPPTGNHNRLPTDIAKQRTRNRQNCTRGLRCAPWSP